ncbi:hypothetical protein BS50DRAFT_352077 [Corynespora cassiicola Philippines]|uniref:Uncharacterized protein n=1 Tax=Corynespora cassiicola Philippines TaxID=1448308 RepID=A0A2T2NR54_CORCC|nr:hypothetical protein BS50DRAFT_352077 [Corynespora cassiicola Philippines]
MAQEDTPMTNAPLTPGEDQDPEPTSPAIDFSPATVAYDEKFENALMTAVLYPKTDASLPTPPVNPPMVQPTMLPVPVNSPLRTHTSPIPGLLLTHKKGYHTGGPGPSPSTVNEFAKKFIEEHGIEDAGQLERIVEEKMQEKLEEVKERMREREEALNKNKAVERELEDLAVQRSAELRVAEKIKGGKRGV